MQKVELRYLWEYGDKKTRINELNDKCSIWKINFRSSILRLSELPKCKERPQTAMYCLE